MCKTTKIGAGNLSAQYNKNKSIQETDLAPQTDPRKSDAKKGIAPETDVFVIGMRLQKAKRTLETFKN
jgi:hypothetical protein